MSIWGNVILPQKDGFIYGEKEPGVPCLWFDTGGAQTPADPDVPHGMLLYRDDNDILHPLYPMTTMEAVYGLMDNLEYLKNRLNAVKSGIRSFSASITVPSEGWEGAREPYTQTVALDGILEADDPQYGVVLSGDLDNKLTQMEAYDCIIELTTGNGTVTLSCIEKPDTDITIRLVVNRWDESAQEDAILKLSKNTEGNDIIAAVDGQQYGVQNASVNAVATESNYDFTIL
ncbi:MAG: hypothetical protein ACI3V1_06410 [Faecousia sp.]